LHGYPDSEFYSVSQPPARRHPPTPRSHYSDVTDQEIDHYPYTNEGSPFIPPPPTPHQTSDAEDDA
jgi:hypothetical protein